MPRNIVNSTSYQHTSPEDQINQVEQSQLPPQSLSKLTNLSVTELPTESFAELEEKINTAAINSDEAKEKARKIEPTIFQEFCYAEYKELYEKIGSMPFNTSQKLVELIESIPGIEDIKNNMKKAGVRCLNQKCYFTTKKSK